MKGFLAPLEGAQRLLVTLSLALGAGAAGLTCVNDGDLWWHLAAGREMVASGAVLRADPFSVSAAGRPWVDVHWLFQLLSYGLHQLGGLPALLALKCGALAGGAWLLGRALCLHAGRGALLPFALLLVSALAAARDLLLLRPVLVSLVFLALFSFELERFRTRASPRLLWLLPALQVVWANIQGLSALGAALVAAYAVGALGEALFGRRPAYPFVSEAARGSAPWPRARLLLATLALTLLAGCVTPFGAHAALFPLRLLQRLWPSSGNAYASQVVENVAPLSLEALSSGQFWHLPWFLALLFVSVAFGSRRLLLSHLLVLLGFTALALSSNRNVLLLYWVACPLVVLQLRPRARQLALLGRSLRVGFVARVLCGTALTAVLFTVASAAAREPNLAESAPFRVPAESARRIAERAGNEPIFAADSYGGYLIWQLFPKHRPYADTRWMLRSQREFEHYLALADHPERFDAFQREQRFGYVLLPSAYPDRYLGLIQHLYRSPEWQLLFTDGAEVLFARRTRGEAGWDLGTPAVTANILRGIEQRFAGAPALRSAARVQLATLQAVLGHWREAELALLGVELPEAEALLSRVRFAQGDAQGARRLVEHRRATSDADTRSLNLLAAASLQRGEMKEALSLLKQSLSVNPFDSEADALLRQLEVNADVHTSFAIAD